MTDVRDTSSRQADDPTRNPANPQEREGLIINDDRRHCGTIVRQQTQTGMHPYNPAGFHEAVMKFLAPITFSLLFTAIVPLSGILSQATAFSIEQPKAFSNHPSHQPIAVVINVGEVTGITGVGFYWYGEQEDMVKAFVGDKQANVTTSPPFGVDLRPPRGAIGTYRLLAVAEQKGRQNDNEEWAVFDEILLHIHPHSPLQAIEFQTDKPLKFGRAGAVRVYDQLDFLGKTIDLPVVGRFADGTVRSIRSASTGTTYHVEDPSVVTISQHGQLQLTGNGGTTLTVRNGGLTGTLEVLVEVNAEPNQPPVADPGPTRTIASNRTVVLSGLNSYDPEGWPLQYRWGQIRGSKVGLLDPYASQARFLAPFVVEPRLFRFQLKVTDAQGADSIPAWVDVVVEP